MRARSCLASTSPVPALTSLSPASAPAGSSALTVTLVGAGFTGGSVVRMGGVLAASTFVSPTELRVTIAASELTRVRDLEVIVLSSTGRASAPMLFPVLLAGRTGVALTAGGVRSASENYRFIGALTSGVGAVTNARSARYLSGGGVIAATEGATR